MESERSIESSSVIPGIVAGVREAQRPPRSREVTHGVMVRPRDARSPSEHAPAGAFAPGGRGGPSLA